MQKHWNIGTEARSSIKTKVITLYRKVLRFFVIALLVFFLARFLLLLLHRDAFSTLEVRDTIIGFIHGVRFDLSSITVFSAIPLLLLTLPFRWARSTIWQAIWVWSLYFILMAMVGCLLGDIIYFDYVKRHTTYELFVMGEGDASLLGELLFSVFLPYLIAYLVVAVLMALTWYRWIAHPVPAIVGWKCYAGFALFFFGLVIAGRGGVGYKPIAIIDAFATGNTQQANLRLNGVFSISHSALKAEDATHQYFGEQEAFRYLDRDPSQANTAFPFQREVVPGSEPMLNLVFVLIESLSFKYVDAFGQRGYGVTPNLDQLSEQGLKYTNFYAAGQRSIEGIQATLTGLPPVIGLPTIGSGLLSNYSKLGEIASANGYETIFVQSVKRRSFRLDAIAGSAGFKAFYGKEDMQVLLDYPDPEAAKWGWDYETYMTAADCMERTEKPFLVYIVTSTTHTPYPPLPPDLEIHPFDPNSEMGFLNTVYYTDWSIGQFFDRVRRQPWFSQTIFILTADHALAHYQGGDFADRFHIPLLIYAPGIFEPKTITTVCSQIDIFPTIIDLLELGGRFSAFGASLFQESPERFAIVREGSIMGILTNQGFLRHSLKHRLETGTFGAKDQSVDFDELERKLLAADQLIYQAVQGNRWAMP
jgi:phosphoglycerol transferase MdoB-like AlkP superfamily enzyme